ncbi:MAG: LytTR family DNA-binding domain-containing protein [Syntrophomonadaceae bacterium]|nr:LytTR family DNA-binding domain-containing protein [Syntrophomonadaceae bacterium]
MRIMAVDDEKIALEALKLAICEARPGADVNGFRDPAEALAYAAENTCDVAFLDIQTGSMSGIELAKRLKLQNPKINIIFATGYSEYQGEAFDLHASGYVLKPITAKKIAAELADLRHPAPSLTVARVQVRTFGNFEVYLDDLPVKFQYGKTKEMFAYLIDRQGALCTNKEIMAVLWEDEVKDSYFRNIRVDLFKSLPEDIFIRQWGKLAVMPERISCDYYDWITGKLSAINAYNGEYMTQYSWSERTLSTLKHR